MASNVIAGRAKKHDGTAIDYVSIFNWTDGKCIAQVKPDQFGNWRYIYTKNLQVGITYVADGCEPITHGAYDFTHPSISKKWWRIKAIKNADDGDGSNKSRSVAELRFNTLSGLTGSTVTKAFAASALSGVPISRAFDGNSNTFFHSGYDYTGDWFIGYQFDAPEALTSISLQMRGDMQPAYKQEWQTATIEYSDDGVAWTKYGVIEPKIANMDLSLITTPIITD